MRNALILGSTDRWSAKGRIRRGEPVVRGSLPRTDFRRATCLHCSAFGQRSNVTGWVAAATAPPERNPFISSEDCFDRCMRRDNAPIVQQCKG
jgi:hypothetical protein